MKQLHGNWESLKPAILAKAAILLKFFTTQSLTMVFSLLFGLACLRLMAAEDYAKFVVVNAVMGTVLILMDLNLTGTLVPLIGERVHDNALIADYVASLRRLSAGLYVLIGLGTIVAFPLLVRHRGWSRGTVAAMVVAILVTTWFARMLSNYLPVLMVKGDRDRWYSANLAVQAGGLLPLILLWAFHWLGAFQAITINVIGYAALGLVCWHRSGHLLSKQGRPDAVKQKAIVQLAAPNIPQSIFFALQGQLSLYLLTYFGRTQSVASIGALSRLGQLFTIFTMANGVLVEPYFAKLPREKLKKNFALALFIAASISISVWSVSALFPDILLWVLGSQYRAMHHELRLAVGASAISFFSAMFWGVNTARRFVYWWNVALSIALIFGVQAAFLWKGNVSSLTTALWMNIGVNCASLAANIAASVWGFARGPRAAEHVAEITTAEQETLMVLELAELERQTVPASPEVKI